MRIRVQRSFSDLLLYLAFGTAMFCLSFIGNHAEPFGLAIVYAMQASGLSAAASLFLYVLSAAPSADLTVAILYTAQAVLLSFGFFLQRKARNSRFWSSSFFPMLFLSVGLGLFVAVAPFSPYALPLYLTERFAFEEFGQKAILSAGIFLLSASFSVAVKALLRKLLKCRLRNDEIVFCILLLTLIGVGICRFFGINAYMGVAFFILLLFSYAVKDATTLFATFVVSLPPFLVFHLSPERFFVYGVCVALFIKSGRLSASFALLAVFFAYGYVDGLYTYPTHLLVSAVLSAILPALLFILLPTPFVRSMENKLIFYREKHLSRIAINRNRTAIGEQLFEISAVFREISATFHTLGDADEENGAKEYIRNAVMNETCKNCPQSQACLRKHPKIYVDKLVDVGCLKGKVHLIDIPRELAEICVNQSGLLYAINKQLGEYRKYMTEAENAASGRAMLANQAQGVSEILKNLALEQSEPLRLYTEKERALNVALLSVGIVCSEVLIFGTENNPTLSLITFGKADVKKIANVASHLFKATMIISEKITLSDDKFCCILRKKPYFDAAFGIANTIKGGESASGDTHSVIKIDERRFMVALSDGMGSGEYAKRISESTISLLESFYRAKMPSELVLSTVNKLLTFNKEESFACVDIAVVDLDSGIVDVVKIGSPIGFILSGNTVKVLETNSLPLGILDALHPDTASYTLVENDVLLFLSDGVVDAFGSTTDLYDVLRSVPLRNPQQLADALLERAIHAYGGKAKDDMTAVAVRLFKADIA